MKLISASGSPRMQKALTHTYVRDIVAILKNDPSLLKDISILLKTYQQRAQPGFLEELDAFCMSRRFVDTTGIFIIPKHVRELAETLQNLYRQSYEDIRYQRGAILELLVHKYVCPRYKAGECLSNHRFIDGQYASDQIDVAALSRECCQIEGYECKLKVDGVESADCTNLSCLVEVGERQGYQAHVGIVSLDDERYMRRKLERLQPAACIKLYGLNNIGRLKTSPFL